MSETNANAVAPVAQSPAVETKTEIQPAAGQMSLMGFMDARMGTVFGAREMKNKDGRVIGTAIGRRHRKDIAVANGLTTKKEDKEKLDALINAQGIEAFQAALSELVRAKGTVELITGKQYNDRNGLMNISIRAREVKKPNGPTDEQIAKSLGCTVEEVQAMRNRQQEALKKQEAATVDVSPAANATEPKA